MPTKQLEEIIQGGLEGNEYVSLLSWVMNIYPGQELMSHPDLQVDLSSLEPLINERSLKELENEYLKVRLSFCPAKCVGIFLNLFQNNFPI